MISQAARFAALARPKKGRPLKPNVNRYPCGDIREENPEAVQATALDARVRLTLGVDHWQKIRETPKAAKKARDRMKDPDHGCALGRLVIAERMESGMGLSREQFEIGRKYATMRIRHAKVMGFAPITPKSPAMVMVAKETGDGTELPEEEIMRIRRQYGDVHARLADIGAGYSRPTPQHVIDAVCLENADPTPHELRILRVALNSLRRIL
jgi:hypothetical protein